MSYLEVESLIKQNHVLQLTSITGQKGFGRHIITIDVNRPGLALVGYFKNFGKDRIQIFGRGECAYLREFSGEKLEAIINKFFSYQFPCVIFTHGVKPPDFFIKIATETNTPVLTTPLTTHSFILNFTHIIGEVLAPRTSIHGVLIDVFGVGILLVGASGIGKSETALELVERGHRLVADDIVEVICLEETDLYGMASDILQHHMELRGLGIINAKDLFGIRAIRGRYPLDLVVRLEDWDIQKDYERLGLDERQVDIIGVQVPHVFLPVRPGRNLPILIETAAINHRSKKMGLHAVRDLSRRVADKINDKKEKSKKKKNNYKTEVNQLSEISLTKKNKKRKNKKKK